MRTIPDEMRVARLHGLEDLRIELVPVPEPGPGELLVEVEANGVCATDARKYRVGVNDGEYPFNPGHEWVGRVAATGVGTTGWQLGDRIYGDTYGGYADYITVPVEPGTWSCGPVRLDDGLPIERAIFLEPIADCFHALVDQAGVMPGLRVVVVAAGSMGLLMVGLAVDLGADVIAVEPQDDRRDRALQFGASTVLEPTRWPAALRDHWAGADVVVLCTVLPIWWPTVSKRVPTAARWSSLPASGTVPEHRSTSTPSTTGRYLSWEPNGWGRLPRKRCSWYNRAGEVVGGDGLPLESLITHRCSYDGLETALVQRSSYEVLKTMFTPGGGP